MSNPRGMFENRPTGGPTQKDLTPEGFEDVYGFRPVKSRMIRNGVTVHQANVFVEQWEGARRTFVRKLDEPLPHLLHVFLDEFLMGIASVIEQRGGRAGDDGIEKRIVFRRGLLDYGWFSWGWPIAPEHLDNLITEYQLHVQRSGFKVLNPTPQFLLAMELQADDEESD